MAAFAGYISFNPSDQKDFENISVSMLSSSQSSENNYQKAYLSNGDVFFGVSSKNGKSELLDAERFIVLFHGRLTNKKELSDLISSDIERFTNKTCHLVLRLFLKYKKDMVQYLKGIFAFAIWDKMAKKLIIGTDRHGYGFIYYYKDKGRFIFASEIKSILNGLNRRNEVNVNGIFDIYNYHAVYGNDTPFKDIYLLPHATVCDVSEETIEFSKYWDYPLTTEHFNLSIDHIIELAREKLRLAVLNSMGSKNEIGIMLTGGLDSRLILGVINRYFPEKQVRLFHFTPSTQKEISIVHEISNILGYPLEIYDISSNDLSVGLDKIFSDGHINSFLPLVIQIYEKYHDITMFNGYLLDTLFKSGFAFFPKEGNAQFSVSPEEYIKRFSYCGDYIADRFFLPEVSELIKKQKRNRIYEALDDQWFNHPTEASIRFYCINRGRREIYNTSKMFGDFINMSLPGTDYDLIDFAFKIPYSLRSNSNMYRRLIYEWFPSLGSIPWEKTGKALNSNYRKYSKMTKRLSQGKYTLLRLSHGRIDLLNPPSSFDRMLRRDKKLIGQVKDILFDKRSIERGFFGKEQIERLFQSHLSGRNHGEFIKSLLAVEFIFRKFIDAI